MGEPKPSLLIVDDEKTQREGLRAALEDDYEVYLADSAAAARELLDSESFDVLLTDFRMPSEDGLNLITHAKSMAKPPICILMTAYGSEEMAVEAIRRGADDYISKGKLNIDELDFRIKKAMRQHRLEKENVVLRERLDKRFGLENLIGETAPMHAVVAGLRQTQAAGDFLTIARKLVDRGADVNARDVLGRTPLFGLVRNLAPKDERAVALLDVLVELGADVNATDRAGMVPLFAPANESNVSMVQTGAASSFRS